MPHTPRQHAQQPTAPLLYGLCWLRLPVNVPLLVESSMKQVPPSVAKRCGQAVPKTLGACALSCAGRTQRTHSPRALPLMQCLLLIPNGVQVEHQQVSLVVV